MKYLSFLLTIIFYNKVKGVERVTSELDKIFNAGREVFDDYAHMNVGNAHGQHTENYFEYANSCKEGKCKGYTMECNGDDCKSDKQEYSLS